MPLNTHAHTPSPTATHHGATRHRVDRQDELCEDVPQEKRWVAVELQRREPVQLVLECDLQQVTVTAGERLPNEAPEWVARVLEYLGLEEFYEE